MDRQKIEEYGAKLDSVLGRLTKNYLEKEDYGKAVPLFKEIEKKETGAIKKYFKNELDRYERITTAYIERRSALKNTPGVDIITIKTHGPVTQEQFLKLIDKRERKIERFRKGIDFLIEELTENYREDIDRKILSVFDKAKKQDIIPEKELEKQHNAYRIISRIYSYKMGEA